MLDKEAQSNLNHIKSAAQMIWNDACQFGEINVLNAPYSMFQLPACIYKKHDVLFSYDRSILGIYVKNQGEYVNIRRFTTDEIIGGFDSCKPDSLLHNFVILDNVLSSMR